MEKIKQLPTEQRNVDTIDIDEVSTFSMLQMINNEDKKVANSITPHLQAIADAVDALAEVFSNGGRIVYCGAGTSGRLGFIDAAECRPTYGVEEGRIIALIAGGEEAMRQAVEGAEDLPELCVEDLQKIGFSSKDALVGIAASGRTPYVVGGLEYANRLGSVTVSITCNEDVHCPVNKLAKYPIGIYAGPEAITGSTRMKSGTVQKLVLNMLSTGIMVKNGKVYSNLMVHVQTSNMKLVERAQEIVELITGADDKTIQNTLQLSNNDVSKAVLMIKLGCTVEQANDLLLKNNGHIKNAIAMYRKK